MQIELYEKKSDGADIEGPIIALPSSFFGGCASRRVFPTCAASSFLSCSFFLLVYGDVSGVEVFGRNETLMVNFCSIDYVIIRNFYRYRFKG